MMTSRPIIHFLAYKKFHAATFKFRTHIDNIYFNHYILVYSSTVKLEPMLSIVPQPICLVICFESCMM